MVYNTCAFRLAFVRMWLINIRFHISQSKERERGKLSLSAIIKSNLYFSGHANGLNYFLLDFNESCSNTFYLKEMLNNLCLLSFSGLDRSIDIKECDIRRNPYESANNKRAARRDRNRLWHDGVIPYEVHTSVPGMMDILQIK